MRDRSGFFIVARLKVTIIRDDKSYVKHVMNITNISAINRF